MTTNVSQMLARLCQMGRPPWPMGAVAAVVLALVHSSTGAAPSMPGDLDQLITDLNVQAGNCVTNFATASEKLADADLAGAKTAVESCLSTINDAIGTVQYARGQGYISATAAAGLILQYTLAKARLSNSGPKNGTLDYINGTLNSDGVNTVATGLVARSKSEIVASLMNAQTRHESTLRNVNLRLKPATPKLILAADRPSLHNASSTVCWRILGIPTADRRKTPASNCPITVVGVNPATGLGINAIQNPATPLIAPNDNPCTGRICFLLDQDMGGGNIEIQYNATKVTERILFNRGNGRSDNPNTMGEPMGQLSGGSQFAGTYSGGYVGSFTYTGKEETCGQPPGTTQGQSGGAGFVVSATGKMTVTAPGSGSGTVTGIGGSTTGGLAVAGGTSRFVGAIMTNRLNNVATARGTWSYSHSCGKGSGTWLATRSGPPP